MLDAVVFQQPQHAINIGYAAYIHGSFGPFIHGGEIPCEPVLVGEIEPIAPGLERCMIHAILSPARTAPP